MGNRVKDGSFLCAFLYKKKPSFYKVVQSALKADLYTTRVTGCYFVLQLSMDDALSASDPHAGTRWLVAPACHSSQGSLALVTHQEASATPCCPPGPRSQS